MSGRAPRARRARDMLVVLGVALALRLVVQAEMAGDPDTYAPIIDSEAYLLQALRVADGRDVVEGVYFQAPLYPLVLGGLLAAGGVTGASSVTEAAALPPDTAARALDLARALNVVLGLAAALLVWRVGERLYSPGAGLAAGLLAAAYGPFLFFEGHVLKVSLSLLFLPWAVLAAVRALRRGRATAYAWCGVALGLGGLVQGHFAALVPLAALAPLVRPPAGRDRRFGARAGAAVLAGALVVALPVIVRNSLVEGRLVLSSAQGGAAFFLCNNPGNPRGIAEHSDAIRQVPRHERDDFRAETERLAGRPLAADEVSRFWTGRALSWIAGSPGAWLAIEGRKVLALLSRHESADNTGYALGARTSRVLAWTPARFGFVLPLALGGLVLARRRRRRSDAAPAGGRAALALGLLGYAAVVLLFCVTARYRMPMLPLLLVPAGVLLAGLGEVIVRGPRVAVGLALAAGLLATLAAEGPWGPFDAEELARQAAVRDRNRGLVAFGRGDLDEAERDLRRALSEHPGGIAVHVDLAELHLARATQAAEAGDGAGAAAARSSAGRELARAIALGSENGPTWRRMGLLAYRLGDDAAAARCLGEALARGSGDRTARQYLCLSRLAQGSEAAMEDAVAQAEWLAADAPDADDGWGLLALARLAQGRTEEARAAVQRYDEAAAARESAGAARRLPDQPGFAELRTSP